VRDAALHWLTAMAASFERTAPVLPTFPVLQIVLPLRQQLLQTTDPIAVVCMAPGPVPQGLALGDRCLAFRGAGKIRTVPSSQHVAKSPLGSPDFPNARYVERMFGVATDYYLVAVAVIVAPGPRRSL
jgi:hypothetical protein